MIEGLRKAPSGIAGLDELTGGGLPQGRATLVCGGPGCGKTLLATSFLAQGVLMQGEAGVLMSFDERIEDLQANSLSLGLDLEDLQRRNLLAMDFVYLDRNELEESGAFDLEGLFIRLDLAIRTVGAKRVILDTIDALFAGLPNEAIVRSELRRLLGWLKDRGMTTVVTAERGDGSFTRHGVEEYISDCVILLDQRVTNEIATRRLRVVKYRGSTHGSNEYPFLIGNDGIAVMPVTSLGLVHDAPDERLSSGVAGLDRCLDGRGYFRGSSVMISGGPGSGKTSLASQFLDSVCARGERAIYFSFEESPKQLVRNMRSVGTDLQQWMDRGLLRCHAARPTEQGLEMHLAVMYREVQSFAPTGVVVDPVSALLAGSDVGQVQIMVLRLVDYLKSIGATTVLLSLQPEPTSVHTELNISSLMDTWLMVRTLPEAGGPQRTLQVIKSRGMPHSLEPQPMAMTSRGVKVGKEAQSK